MTKDWESSLDGCPNCASEDLDYGIFEQLELGDVLQRVHCLECKTSWTEVYRLSCITDLTKPKQAQ